MLAAFHTSDGIALGAGVVALLSFGAAIWSVVVARGANKLSEESNELARQAVSHTARQTDLAEAAERERQRQAGARAVMKSDIAPLHHTVQASTALFRPLVRVRNEGERDSGRAVVRVYMQAGNDLMAWDDEHTRADRTRPINDPSVKFYDQASGAEIQTQYIQRIVDNVTPTMPVEFRVILPVPIPREGQGVYRLPVRVIVRADHADQPFEWTDYVQTEYGPPPR
jgi:hypothetical protein